MLKFMPADARAQLDAVANALTGVLGERLEGYTCMVRQLWDVLAR